MEGSQTWTWSDGQESCSGSESLSVTRCAAPVDIAGDWLMTATPIEDTCYGDLTPYTFGVTIVQDGNALAGQTFGATLPGTICGNQIQMNGSFSEYGETSTVNLQLTASADGNSVEGSDTWTWTDGVESCGGSESLSGIRIDVPAGWTCPVEYYGTADGCDCGCGALDPDCIDGTVASCEYCAEPGSCSISDCPGDIDPTQNWLCDGGTAVCGDDIAQWPEQCDGVDLQGLDCTAFGFTGGTLACLSDCSGFDTSSCTAPGDLCINDADRAVYESLEYTDQGGTPSTCIDAATAIAADCPIVGCVEETFAVFECYPGCPPDGSPRSLVSFKPSGWLPSDAWPRT